MQAPTHTHDATLAPLPDASFAIRRRGLVYAALILAALALIMLQRRIETPAATTVTKSVAAPAPSLPAPPDDRPLLTPDR